MASNQGTSQHFGAVVTDVVGLVTGVYVTVVGLVTGGLVTVVGVGEVEGQPEVSGCLKQSL